MLSNYPSDQIHIYLGCLACRGLWWVSANLISPHALQKEFFEIDRGGQQHWSAHILVLRAQTSGYCERRTLYQLHDYALAIEGPYIPMPMCARTGGVSLAQSAFECVPTSTRMSKKVFWSKAFSCFLLNFAIASTFEASCPWAAMMLASVVRILDCLKTMWVGNRVQRPESLGNGSPVKPSSTELLLLD